MKPTPIVLVQIDANSRLHILQDPGVRIAFVDHRIDPHLVFMPEVDQRESIDTATATLTPLTPSHDDLSGTAKEHLRRLAAGDVVVAAGPITKEAMNG